MGTRIQRCLVLRSRGVSLSVRRLRAAAAIRMEQQQTGSGSKTQVNVDITSDVVCPWCWVGKKHLDAAMERLSESFDFRVHWKPYLLNADMPEEGIPLEQYFRHKFGEEAAQRFWSDKSPLMQSGKAVGITFNRNRLVVPTKKAHLLLDYAVQEGKQHELHEVLFRSYFTDGKNIASDIVLGGILAEVGLNVERAMARLSDSTAVREFEEAVKDAQRKGVNGVPNFEIYLRGSPSVRQVVSGAQPVDTMVSVFNRLRTLAKV